MLWVILGHLNYMYSASRLLEAIVMLRLRSQCVCVCVRVFYVYGRAYPMILAPPEKLNLYFNFHFYFMSLPFEFRAEILYFFHVFLLENYFISSN